MNKYKRVEFVEAKRWFKNGDHKRVKEIKCNGNGENTCGYCGDKIKYHGNFDGFFGKVVCPGDWVVDTKISGTGHIIMKNDEFVSKYEECIADELDIRLKQLESKVRKIEYLTHTFVKVN